MPFLSRNPATGETVAEHDEMSREEVLRRIDLAQRAYEDWREMSYSHRANLFRELAKVFRLKAESLAEIAAIEMGRPITVGISEIEKCAKVCEYYADNAEKMLAPTPAVTEAREAYVCFGPIGIVLAVMPWNYPYWQVMRFAAPTLMAGNVGLLKHASNVQGCAAALEALFFEAGFPTGTFLNLAISPKEVEAVLRDSRIKAATLTGSEKAGKSVGGISGDEIKKTVLELGGSDPFIVLEDADLEPCAAIAMTARLQNSGQSCIAAKRFIVVRSVAERFTALLKENFETKVVLGDPRDRATTFGPMATEGGLADMERQVAGSVALGAKVLTGGKRADRPGWFFEPTILTDVRKGMPAYDEETFGPIAPIIVVENEEEAIAVANDTEFGLGASVWTKDVARGKRIANRINAGFVGVNDMVKSEQTLPFGGIGKSGYGRELSEYGLKEFTNIKTVRIG